MMPEIKIRLKPLLSNEFPIAAGNTGITKAQRKTATTRMELQRVFDW
jgi:hypothetical protein